VDADQYRPPVNELEGILDVQDLNFGDLHCGAPFK
jgi:hypothetical protein